MIIIYKGKTGFLINNKRYTVLVNDSDDIQSYTIIDNNEDPLYVVNKSKCITIDDYRQEQLNRLGI